MYHVVYFLGYSTDAKFQLLCLGFYRGFPGFVDGFVSLHHTNRTVSLPSLGLIHVSPSLVRSDKELCHCGRYVVWLFAFKGFFLVTTYDVISYLICLIQNHEYL